MGTSFFYTVKEMLGLLGSKVTIKAPGIDGEIEEIIFDRQKNVLIKVKFWIDGDPCYHVCCEDELRINRPPNNIKMMNKNEKD